VHQQTWNPQPSGQQSIMCLDLPKFNSLIRRLYRSATAQFPVKLIVLPAAVANAFTSLPTPTLELATMPLLEPKPTENTMHKVAPCPRLTITLPGCYTSRPTRNLVSPGDPARTLEQGPRFQSILMTRYYHAHTMAPHSCLTTMRSARSGSGLLSGIQPSRLSDLICMQGDGCMESMDFAGWCMLREHGMSNCT